jgi:hypothetical protein
LHGEHSRESAKEHVCVVGRGGLHMIDIQDHTAAAAVVHVTYRVCVQPFYATSDSRTEQYINIFLGLFCKIVRDGYCSDKMTKIKLSFYQNSNHTKKIYIF